MQIRAESLDMLAGDIPEAAEVMKRALIPSSTVATVATSSSSSSAAGSSSSSAAESPTLSAASPSPSSSEETVPHYSIQCIDKSDNYEQNLHRIAYQVYSDQPLNDAQHLFLSQYQSNGTLKSELLHTALNILRKPSLTTDEKVTVELFLSSIVHTLNSFASSCLPVSIIETLNQLPLESKGMEEETVKVFDTLTEILTDAETLNLEILKLKIELAEKGKTHSEQYIMLSIMSRVVDDFPLWRDDSCESETTFYRRFANLLDVLFKHTKIQNADGESGLQCTKLPIEINKALFNVKENSKAYPRKIDLILKLDDKTEVEMSSNEWKRAKVSDSIKIHQQTKNLKLNACIVSELSTYGGTVAKTLIMDWIGTAGYMYELELVEDVFFARLLHTLMIPKTLETLPLFKSTLNALFILRKFMISTSTKLKQHLQESSLSNILSPVINSVDDEDSDTSRNSANDRRYSNTKTPRNIKYVFFPEHVKRRKTSHEEEQ